MQQSNEQTGRLHFQTANGSDCRRGEKIGTSRTENKNDSLKNYQIHDEKYIQSKNSNDNEQYEDLRQSQIQLSPKIDQNCEIFDDRLKNYQLHDEKYIQPKNSNNNKQYEDLHQNQWQLSPKIDQNCEIFDEQTQQCGKNENFQDNSSYWWDERSLTQQKFQSKNLYCNQRKKLSATIDLDCEYVRNLVISAFERRCKIWQIQILNDKEKLDQPNQLSRSSEFFWGEYERIHWDKIMAGEQFTACYCVRKGLIRKAHLAFNVKKWISKRGKNGILAKNVPLTFILDVPDIDYFEEAMSDLPEIRGIYPFEKNRKIPVQTWIAKPSLINQANAIFIFKNEQQLKENLIQYPDLREWVIQEYIEPPLLIQGRKFHIRTYVLCVGNLDVFVYKNMLALFASQKYYNRDDDDDDDDLDFENGNYFDLNSHLTNTCRVEGKVNEDEIVFLLNEIELQNNGQQKYKCKNDYNQINFESNESDQLIQFQNSNSNFERNHDVSNHNNNNDPNFTLNNEISVDSQQLPKPFQSSNSNFESNDDVFNRNNNNDPKFTINSEISVDSQQLPKSQPKQQVEQTDFSPNFQFSTHQQQFSQNSPKQNSNGHLNQQSQSENSFSIEQIHDQIFKLVGESFECIVSELTFQSLPNAFELFGFDFMLSEDGRVWLLEANAEPDLKQTGCRLKGCMDGLIEGVMRLAVDKFAMQSGRWDGRVEPWGMGEQWKKVYSREKQ